MRVLCAFARFNYGLRARGTSIESEAFLPALRDLGHDVKLVDTWDRERFADYGSLNYALLAVAKEFQPQIFFTVQRDYEIWMETVDTIKDMGAVAITWTTDDSFKFFRVSKFIGPHYDAISTTYAYRLADYKAARIGGACFTQWAANAHWLMPPKAAGECTYPVSFVGTRYGERAAVMERLDAAGIRVECFGYGWPNGPIDTEQIPVIMRDSVISLNFSAGFAGAGGHDLQVKARTFEVPGAGGFLLTDAAPGLEEVYLAGKEIAVFDGLHDLEYKVRHYLDHPEDRDRVARAGHERTRNCHTYAHRLEDVLRVGLARAASRRAPPTSYAEPRDTTGLQSSGTLPRRRPLGWLERGVRWLLVGVCQRIWHGERGVKAGRRICFEISIRLLGRRTFTAKGLPGRMFPFV